MLAHKNQDLLYQHCWIVISWVATLRWAGFSPSWQCHQIPQHVCKLCANLAHSSWQLFVPSGSYVLAAHAHDMGSFPRRGDCLFKAWAKLVTENKIVMRRRDFDLHSWTVTPNSPAGFSLAGLLHYAGLVSAPRGNAFANFA